MLRETDFAGPLPASVTYRHRAASSGSRRGGEKTSTLLARVLKTDNVGRRCHTAYMVIYEAACLRPVSEAGRRGIDGRSHLQGTCEAYM